MSQRTGVFSSWYCATHCQRPQEGSLVRWPAPNPIVIIPRMGQPATPPPRHEAASAGVVASGNSTAKAAAWMVGWLLMMTAIAVAGREATRELSIFQVMLLRSLIGLMVLAPLVQAAGGLQAMRTQRLKSHALRNLVHYAAQYAWLAALALIPLAQVVALEFTMPIWTALLAYAFLGERLDARKIRGWP